ncbi:dual OB domain-containing protein [Anoxynatronum sibiricum]|uniref:Dual OB-containing domain-containing protein n=1 Tax=Anoxynatronum sibiricum TaxID=210623 RepID=A0ABU9VWN5_9CLOT
MKKSIILLTKSKKYRNYCIAGIDINNGEWVRIVSNDTNIHYAVKQEDIMYENNEEAEIFDIIAIECEKDRKSYYQSENYIFDNAYYWEKIGKATINDVLAIKPCENRNFIFYDTNKKVASDYLKTINSDDIYSLMLICPTNVEIIVKQWSHDEEKKITMNFEYNSNRYRYIPITDEIFNNQHRTKIDGNYSLHYNPILIMSLGEMYERDKCHYKLIASVLT